MMKRKLFATILTFILSFSIAGNTFVTLHADDLDSVIFQGIVRDSAGAVVEGARVVARHTATGVERSALTNSEGRYRIIAVSPGDYRLKAGASGFREQEYPDIPATTGRVVTLDFMLIPSGVSEQMAVAATDVPLVDTTRTVAGDTITRRELDELPILDRNVFQLVYLIGGSVEPPFDDSGLAEEGRGVFLRDAPEESGIFSLAGAPATSNNITIDGLDNNDDRAARERIALNPESIAEVQVITNQFAAEYGRASGGRINLRTRGGTNRFRGEGYWYFGDDALNANTFFRNARGLGRIPQRELREGIVFSGPIRRNKHFFLASYERLDVSDYAEISALVPTQTNSLFPLPLPNQPPAPGSPVGLFFDEVSTPETRNVMNARADFNFNDSHSATVRFDALRGENKRGFTGGARLFDTLLIQGRDSDSISFSDNLVISRRAVNQARFQYSRLLPRNRAAAESVGVVIDEPGRVVAGAFTGSLASPAFAREEKRAQLQDSLALTLGAHQVKIGADVQFVRSDYTDLFATGGQYEFADVADFLANRPERFIQRYDTRSRLSNDVVGLFVQDEWRLGQGLTLSLGLRWDNESILDDRNNISPRLAIAWDPFAGHTKKSNKSGKTVIRAGFGIFYNRALLRTLDDFVIGRSTVLVDSDITPDALEAVQFPQPLTDQAIISRFGIKETGFLRRVSPDLEIPYTTQTGFGVERQIARNFVATADYIFTRGVHLWREANINAPLLPVGFDNFTEYLLSRDFDNRPVNGQRPISGVNADIVRFNLGANTSTTPGAITTENGVRILNLGLNAPRSANITAALRAVRFLRPDPDLTQVELLESTGNSFYHGGIFAMKYRLGSRAQFRAVYTLSKLIDEGTTNTASPQDLLDRRAERALSLQDQRHRFTFSGQFQVPYLKLDLAPIISFGSSKPFNIGAGADRNLNDISNDRPNFLRELSRPEWRRPGSGGADEVKSALALAPIGSSGNLPRNYGRGPGTRTINLRASRTFALRESIRIRPAVDVFNLFNNAIFSFGSEFIDRDDADFLIPRRTQRPRTVQLSIKVSF
ncbi:MAG TPA: TonB-dependent receptor [Blastocatellia bacterium]|nr:TonB-dependent receptor [Blastocatellia bacterium]